MKTKEVFEKRKVKVKSKERKIIENKDDESKKNPL